MVGRSRLSIAKNDIVKAFKESGPVFTRADIEEILAKNRTFWRISTSTTVNKFIDYLIENTPLQAIRFEFPSRPTIRYVWDSAPVYEVVQSIKPEGYFSHFTAMAFHGLTRQIPKTIYLNFEQHLSGGGGDLSQPAIDRAFRAKPRISANLAPFEDYRICLVNGRYTGRLGVINISQPEVGNVQVTGLERTLIDIAVRPAYSGGVFDVAEAYRRAQAKVSVNKLTAYLRKLDYTYPYHQAIGFYLERSQVYKQSQVELLRQLPMDFDFYLAHNMKKTRYDKRWRLHVPEDF
jgi:predicted transcriptional regulator of viral defense system